MKHFDPDYEAARFTRITPLEADDYRWRYREAARKGKLRYGKRFNYRFEWLESAWSFRRLLRLNYMGFENE